MQLDRLISLDKIPVMIYALNQAEEFIHVNNTFVKETGFKQEELQFKPFLSFLTENSKELFEKVYIPEFKKSHKIENFPLEFKIKNEETIQVLVSGCMGKDNETMILTANPRNVSSLFSQFDNPNSSRERIAKPTEITHKLTKFRQKVNMTQEQMAETLQISTRTFQRLEQGAEKLTLYQIITLATEFDISPSYFFACSDFI